MKVSMIGAGSIAGIMTGTTKEMDYAQNYAMTTRDYGGAAEFARKYGFEKACGSYEELVKDARIKPVHVATPHSRHYEHIRLCLDHGKHVLCERSFTVNESQAREVLELAREKRLPSAEAIWTQYMPMRKTLDGVLLNGIIGRPYMLTANLDYIISGKECIIRPELTGGALLNVGIYPLNFTSMVLGDEMDTITGTVVTAEIDVDAQNSITTTYKNGRMVVLCSSAMGPNDRRGTIYNDNGFIEVKNINNCEDVWIYDRSRNMIASYDTPKQISGYEYEVGACLRVIGEGALGCPEMPRKETLQMVGWMDELRKQ